MMIDDFWWLLMMIDNNLWWLMIIDNNWCLLIMIDDNWWLNLGFDDRQTDWLTMQVVKLLLRQKLGTINCNWILRNSLIFVFFSGCHLEKQMSISSQFCIFHLQSCLWLFESFQFGLVVKNRIERWGGVSFLKPVYCSEKW